MTTKCINDQFQEIREDGIELKKKSEQLAEDNRQLHEVAEILTQSNQNLDSKASQLKEENTVLKEEVENLKKKNSELKEHLITTQMALFELVNGSEDGEVGGNTEKPPVKTPEATEM